MLAEATDVHYETILTGEAEMPLLRELAALPFGRSNHTFAALALTTVDRLIAPFSGTRSRYIEAGRRLQAGWDQWEYWGRKNGRGGGGGGGKPGGRPGGMPGGGWGWKDGSSSGKSGKSKSRKRCRRRPPPPPPGWW